MMMLPFQCFEDWSALTLSLQGPQRRRLIGLNHVFLPLVFPEDFKHFFTSRGTDLKEIIIELASLQPHYLPALNLPTITPKRETGNRYVSYHAILPARREVGFEPWRVFSATDSCPQRPSHPKMSTSRYPWCRSIRSPMFGIKGPPPLASTPPFANRKNFMERTKGQDGVASQITHKRNFSFFGLQNRSVTDKDDPLLLETERTKIWGKLISTGDSLVSLQTHPALAATPERGLSKDDIPDRLEPSSEVKLRHDEKEEKDLADGTTTLYGNPSSATDGELFKFDQLKNDGVTFPTEEKDPVDFVAISESDDWSWSTIPDDSIPDQYENEELIFPSELEVNKESFEVSQITLREASLSTFDPEAWKPAEFEEGESLIPSKRVESMDFPDGTWYDTENNIPRMNEERKCEYEGAVGDAKEQEVEQKESVAWKPPGLLNPGFTCFMNAVVQVFNSIPLIRETLLGCFFDTSNPSFQSDFLSHKTGFFLIELIQIMAEGKSVYGNVVERAKQPYHTRNLQMAIAQQTTGLSCNSNEQQDAHEFLMLARSEIEGILVLASRNNHLRYYENFFGTVDPSPAIQRLKFPSGEENIPVEVTRNAFVGRSCITIRCKTCFKETSRVEYWSDISLPMKLPDGNYSPSLHASLRTYFAEMVFDGDNQYFCCNCNMKTDAVQGTKIEILPRVLTFHLILFERGLKGGTKKITHNAVVPRQIQLEPFLVQSRTDTLSYELKAVVLHRGTTQTRGHYLSMVKGTESDSWALCNDEKVTIISEEDVTKKLELSTGALDNPYLLFYTRRSQPHERE